MIEMFIIAMIVSSVTLRVAGNVAVDGMFAARGKESPRYTRAKAKRAPGAASRYWSQVWEDSWESMLQSHNRRVASRAERPPGPTVGDRWKRGSMRFRYARWNAHNRFKRAMAPVVERLDEKRRTKAARPGPGQVTVPGTVVPNAQDGDEDRPQDGDGTVPTSVLDEDGTDLTFGDDPTDPTGVSSCPECHGTVLVDGTICLSCRDRQEQRNQHHDGPNFPEGWDDGDDPYDRSRPPLDLNSGPDSGPDTDITPPATPTTEGPTMTTIPTGEVTSLSQTIRFCEDSAQAYRAQVHAIEQTQATLSAEEVSGPAADAFAQAMEQSNSAAASMEVAAGEFKKHLIVLEAYDAVQGAGTKRFITAGR
jgi:hypothetical protein